MPQPCPTLAEWVLPQEQSPAIRASLACTSPPRRARARVQRARVVRGSAPRSKGRSARPERRHSASARARLAQHELRGRARGEQPASCSAALATPARIRGTGARSSARDAAHQKTQAHELLLAAHARERARSARDAPRSRDRARPRRASARRAAPRRARRRARRSGLRATTRTRRGRPGRARRARGRATGTPSERARRLMRGSPRWEPGVAPCRLEPGAAVG